MKLKLTLSAFLISASFFASAQFYKYSNEFLSIGIGARGLAMSGAQVADVTDVTSGFWNPAGLASISDNFQIGLMHSEYFAGIAKFDYGSIALPLNNAVRLRRMMAFSLIRFGVDDIPNTLFLISPDGSINYDAISNFSVADYAVLCSYAQETGLEGLQIGGTLKIVHRTAGDFASSWGFGIDAGAQYKKDNWRFGVLAKDITTTFNAWSFNFTDEQQAIFAETNNVIPTNSIELTAPKIIAGAAYQFKFGEKFTVLPELNLDFTTDGRRNVLISANPVSVDPHLGIEGGYQKTIFVRAGVGNLQHMTNQTDGKEITTVQPSVGIGLNIKSISIDYALTNLGGLSSSLYSHVFSLKISVKDKISYGR